MTATRPDPARPLVGARLRLDALEPEDLPALYRAIGRHPETFASGWGNGPASFRDSPAGFEDFARSYLPWQRNNVYAVRDAAGTVIGTTTLGDFDLVNEHAHIGWTAYAPEVWGTTVNPECKLLLLGAAFDHGFGRVKLQADVLNARSRAAILRLGATFEGVTRRDRRRADGSWRDSAIYSILVDEWPRVRAGLQARLDPTRLDSARPDPTRLGPIRPGPTRTDSA
ncbi:MAG: GNAT family protein [Microbacteriaceae bacterium]